MREVLALVRASWLTASSYRVKMTLSLAALLVTVVPVYFIAHAMQPFMADAIKAQGGDYFGFLLLGLVGLSLVTAATSALPSAISSNISSGTLEALLATRVSVSALLGGLAGYALLWTGVRASLLLAAGWAFGMPIAWARIPVALVIVLLLVLAYIPFGLVAASAVLSFRTSGPLASGVVLVSALLGGVYYPTHAIPSWIEQLSAVVPLTYGLRALRQALLEPTPIRQLLPDIAVLAGLAITLLAVSGWLLQLALRRARRAGTLAQY